MLQREIEVLLTEGRAAITAPVWHELYQGVRGKREERHLHDLRQLCIWLDFDARCWELAATHGRTCLRDGTNVPTSDLLIYCCAQHYKVGLLHRDKHFNLIAQSVEK